MRSSVTELVRESVGLCSRSRFVCDGIRVKLSNLVNKIPKISYAHNLHKEHKGQIAKIVISTYLIPGNETVGDYLVKWLFRSLFAKAKVGNVYLGPVYMEVWECR